MPSNRTMTCATRGSTDTATPVVPCELTQIPLDAIASVMPWEVLSRSWARTKAHLSQQELAARMGTSQSTIARLESGASKPTLSTLERIAKATGTKVRISLEPDARSRG